MLKKWSNCSSYTMNNIGEKNVHNFDNFSYKPSETQKKNQQKNFKKRNQHSLFSLISTKIIIRFLISWHKRLFHTQLSIYLFKVNNRNTRKRCELCSKPKIKTSERSQWRRSNVFIVNSEHISYFFVVSLSPTLIG